jgi:hypothetical protein
MNPKLLIFTSVLLIIGCAPPANETDIPFTNHENLRVAIYETEIEFVKDNSEYIKVIGNYTDPNQVIRITEETISSYPYLIIKGGSLIPNVLHKLEIHYTHLRRFSDLIYAPPTSLAPPSSNTIYTREAIATDSIDLELYYIQDSVIEVNTTCLKLNGADLRRSKIKGSANYFSASIDLLQRSSSNSTVFYYDELVTDTTKLFVYANIIGGEVNFQTKMYVQANAFLDVNVGSVAGGMGGNSYNCPDCLCEIYYKGHPTILNHDSLNSKVVLIDNN